MVPPGPTAVTPTQNSFHFAADQDQDDFLPDGEHYQSGEWKGDITVVESDITGSGDDVRLVHFRVTNLFFFRYIGRSDCEG